MKKVRLTVVFLVGMFFVLSASSVLAESHTLFVDSLPRGADVYVADKLDLREADDVPNAQRYYKGKTPLTLLLKEGSYSVHMQIDLFRFDVSKPAKKAVEQYATDMGRNQQARGLYSRPGNPFLWNQSSVTTYGYSGNNYAPSKIGNLFHVRIDDDDKRVVAVWWPKGLSFKDMISLMPPKNIYEVDSGMRRTLETDYALKGKDLATVILSLERCGMAVASVKDPFSTSRIFRLVVFNGPPARSSFNVVRMEDEIDKH